jgi:hypothetical protein
MYADRCHFLRSQTAPQQPSHEAMAALLSLDSDTQETSRAKTGERFLHGLPF